MTPGEMEKIIGPYVGKIWPAFKLNAEQADVWMRKLNPFTVEEVREAIADAYAESQYPTPILKLVLEKARAIRKRNPRSTGALAEDARNKADWEKRGGEVYKLSDLLKKQVPK